MYRGIGNTSEYQDTNRLHRRRLRLMDGTEALAWLRGTEVEKQLRGSEDVTTSLLASSSLSDVVLCGAILRPNEPLCVLQDELQGYYSTTVIPLLAGNDHQIPALSGFYHAYSLVSSRAFWVDAYHCLAMVPIADAYVTEVRLSYRKETDFLFLFLIMIL